jgi:hypothetical protein
MGSIPALPTLTGRAVESPVVDQRPHTRLERGPNALCVGERYVRAHPRHALLSIVAIVRKGGVGRDDRRAKDGRLTIRGRDAEKQAICVRGPPSESARTIAECCLADAAGGLESNDTGRGRLQPRCGGGVLRETSKRPLTALRRSRPS